MPEYTNVLVIARKNKSALIEWNDGDGIHRGFVPTDSIIAADGDPFRVSNDVLAMALPYGVRWSAAEFELDMAAMEQALYRRGIWTVDDVRANQITAVNAIRYAYSANIRSLLDAA